jgi:hypothetical protein
MGAKGQPKTGGRQSGSRNLRTVELAVKRERELASGKPLAKEVLEELMLLYRDAALQFRPPLPIPDDYDADKLRMFDKFADKTMICATRLAPFQSPTYRSITVQAPRDTAMRGTPAIDALEAFVLTLAAVRRKPPETVDLKANEPEPDDTPTLVEVRRNGQ